MTGKQIYERIQLIHSWIKEAGEKDDFDHVTFNQDGTITFNYEAFYRGCHDEWSSIDIPFDADREEIMRLLQEAKAREEEKAKKAAEAQSKEELRRKQYQFEQLKKELGYE